MPKQSRNNLFAFSELLFASMIWGFGFTASIWALKSVDPITMSLIRFGVAFLCGLTLYKIYQHFSPDSRHVSHRQHLLQSLWPGVFLGITIGFQTWGLEYTSATNSGFITTLYVVIVPLAERLCFQKKIPFIHTLWVVLAIIGTLLMIQLQLSSFNKGDILTFICSVFVAFQIIWVGRVQKSIGSAFLFNCYQCFWAGVCSLVLWPLYGELYFRAAGTHAIIGLLSVTFGSTLIAFALQIRAQKILTPTTASMVFLLESPFAAFFAIIFLNESLSLLQIAGGALIFISAIGATVTEKQNSVREK